MQTNDTTRTASLANWRTSPHSGWAFHHVRELIPTADIPNDPANVWELPRSDLDLGRADLDAAVSGMANDALVILHKGALVHESYRNGMGPHDPHILMSVSKSVLGLVAGTCVARGELDVAAPVTEYVPELRGTGFDGATVRHALDMQVGVTFSEDYVATGGPIIEYRRAMGWNPGDTSLTLQSFLATLKESDGPHGQKFHYVSPVTDMLGWLLERASGQRYADLLSQRLWRPMGAERPGYITVDKGGSARAAGGLCLTTRDLARIGQLILQGGARDGAQVVPRSWLEDIWTNGSRAAWDQGDFADRFPGMPVSYRAKWYIHHDARPTLHARGIHGQFLIVDPARQLVVAWFSSEHMPTDPDWAAHVFAAFQRIQRCIEV